MPTLPAVMVTLLLKQALKGQQQGYHDCGQGRHARPLVVIWSSLPCSYNSSSFCTKSRPTDDREKDLPELYARLIDSLAYAA